MGRIGWSKLREVARVASPETESVWLKLCAKRTYRQIERLTALTGYGQWPGEKLPTQRSSDLTELPLTLDPEAQHHLIRARSHLAA